MKRRESGELLPFRYLLSQERVLPRLSDFTVAQLLTASETTTCTMRRAIADSDDEEDDLAIEARDCDIGAVLPEGGGTTDAEVADESLDSTNEKSTGSTGEQNHTQQC